MTQLIQPEDLYLLRFVSEAQISPDGSRVAYVVKTIAAESHEYRSAIWVAPTDGGEPRQFTGGQHQDHTPRWSPDGQSLAFVSDRPGEGKRGKKRSQLWLMPANGGEARQLTTMAHGAGEPVWSPDSQYIAFTARVGEDEDPEQRTADEKGEDQKLDARFRVITRMFYKLDGVGFIYQRRRHIFLIAVSGGEPRQLTDGDWDDSSPAWSPDGRQIAFTSDRTEDRDYRPTDDLYVMPVVAGEPRCLTRGDLDCASPSWSPDGQSLAFLGAIPIGSGGQMDVYAIAATGDGGAHEPHQLTQDSSGTAADEVLDDLREGHASIPPVWSPDGAQIYFLASQAGTTQVFSMPSAGGRPEAVTWGDQRISAFSLDRERRRLALAVTTTIDPGRIDVQELGAAGGQQPIATPNAEFVQQHDIAEPERLEFRGADDATFEGWLIKPRDFDPGQKYPLVLEVHGGPHTLYGASFFFEFQCLAARGYLVLYTNPHGSIGYGADFARSIRGDWGNKDFADVMAAVDTVLQHGYVDAERLGIAGGSYGGFMTNWAIGHTDRFKAAVTQRSVVNMVSMFGSSDVGWLLGDDGFLGTPWENMETLVEHSPLTYVKNMHTPLLIIHSEGDHRCPMEQAEQLFIALKYLGREVELVRFSGASHGLSRNGPPRLRVERLRRIVGWFERYMPGEKVN
jgi:dipeptidyl aminopeptidase/acylaminoacyl peptidase